MRTVVARKMIFFIQPTVLLAHACIHTHWINKQAHSHSRDTYRATGTNTYNTNSRAVLLKYSPDWYSADDKYGKHKARACSTLCNVAPESFSKSRGRSGKTIDAKRWCVSLRRLQHSQHLRWWYGPAGCSVTILQFLEHVYLFYVCRKNIKV